MIEGSGYQELALEEELTTRDCLSKDRKEFWGTMELFFVLIVAMVR